ncbi:membrane-bound lytic murein transglycosylase D [Flavobacterium arsenatis]|uniref:Membrane-bound lytic murein transglycosylase D n=1 Tax=Flavobacterium arsenatis TaxID=1484332 RepID=A0ABU1TTF7_9FLAO|nr:LysM peptidoglycan-binding domain-containing protein [Flavobacterium arsenatis]MDR6969163.1 membrane-bound lytic murein transglycosylase D [Flavobacterium arsenatis]
MITRKSILPLLLMFSGAAFAQDTTKTEASLVPEIKLSYLDSIKATFVHDEIAACVDSLWMKELTDQDIYADLSTFIKSVNLDEKVDYPELSTALLKERLKEMDARSPFNIEYNPGLENLIKSFLKNRKQAFARQMALSEYYFPVFEEALARKNVPLEIKYLAIVESALNPKAVSRVGATGLWQFMLQTGKEYNLNVDSYVDERSDILKSSEAAAQYMVNMHRIFGDWELVLASYNSGAGNVAKAIRRSGGKQNFWNIKDYLPKETQAYVPAFLATMYIYEYHKEHGIVPNRAIVKHFETDTIMIKKQMSFKQISDLVDIPVSQLQLLNPSYKMNVVPVYSNKPHFLRLPKDKIGIFTSNEEKIYAYVQHESEKRELPFENSRWASAKKDTSDRNSYATKTKIHTVRRGESLGAISNKYGVSVAELKKWNNLKGNSIGYGKNLKIVTSEKVKTLPSEVKPLPDKEENTAIASNESKPETAETAEYYTVQKGDNLNSIAKKFGVTIAELKEMNNMEDTNVMLDTKLKIIKGENVEIADLKEKTASKTSNYYIVQKGDNLGAIAKKQDVTVAQIQEWNDLKDTNVQLGAKLLILKESNKQSNDEVVASAKKTTKNSHYLVQKGDSLFKIAQKYPGITVSDIKKWNGISGNDLKPGMKLKISG